MQQISNFILDQALDRHPLTVEANASLGQVIDLMSRSSLYCPIPSAQDAEPVSQTAMPQAAGCVLVLEDARPVGILTEEDIIKLFSARRALSGLTAREVMTQPVLTLPAKNSEDVFLALDLFHRYQIHYLPVVGDQGQLIGLLASKNLWSIITAWLGREKNALPSSQMLSQQVETKISQLERRGKVLHSLALSVGAETGEDFWRSLVSTLSDALTADFAFAGRCLDDHRMRTLAVWENGRPQENFVYILSGTPCEPVVSQHCCVYEQGIKEKFPQDQLLQTLDVEGYAAVALRRATGEVIGIVGILTRQPITESDFVREVLSIFANRASTELERQMAEAERDRFFTLSPDIFCIIDLQGGLRKFNPAFERILGYSTAELAACSVFDLIHPEDRAAGATEIDQLKLGEYSTFGYEDRYRCKDGSYRRLLWSAAFDPQQQLIYATAHDITELKQIGRSLQTKVKQQAEIALLGQLAVSSSSFQQLMEVAVRTVAQTLEVEYCKVLELLPSGETFLLKAGVGWQPGTVGKTVLGTELESQAGYTLHCGYPVISRDLRTEGRFSGPALLHEHDVVSGMSVVIQGSHRPYGVLGAHSTQSRLFGEEDTDFLQSVANLLAQKYEQTQAEQGVRQSEAVLRSIFDNVPLMMGVVELAEDDIIHLSDNAVTASLFGLSPEAMRNRRASELGVPPPVVKMWLARYQEAARTQQTVHFDYAHPTEHGQIWLSATVSHIANKATAQPRFAYVVEDITQRKQTEDRLQEQAALLNVATDAILVRSIDRKIQFWSKGAEVLYGWAVEAALGQDASELLGIDDEESILQHLNRKGSWQGEQQHITKTQQVKRVMSRWTLMQDPQGDPTSILIVNTDITEQKQLEAQFLRAQRMESIGTLASGIAHDLNNILTPILGVAQLLPMQLPNTGQQIEQELKILENSARRGSEIVKQVLSFARGEEGEHAPLDIKHIVSELLSFARKTFPKSLQIQAALPKDLWQTNGDATQIHQVLMNLFVNARDAMPHGGRLSVSAANVVLDRAFVRHHLEAEVGLYILVSVTDTGVGIAPDILDRIFEPFFTTKKSEGGTGLGLSTVHGIVRSHGGFVRAYSELGTGTQFRVYLPAIKSAEIDDCSSPSELPLGKGDWVLIVDDEKPILDIARSILEAHNYQVLTAQDGVEAIAQYTQHQADVAVVLMDMTMPTLDGATTIQILQKIDPDLKVIVASGLPDNEQVAASLGSSVKAFIPKPYAPTTLLQSLQSVL